jgi:hypothetical protein
MVDWLIVVLGVSLTISGLTQVDAMGPKTNNMIRVAGVCKTAGATLIAFVHMAVLVGAQSQISDDIPVLLFLAGALLHRIADRRRRSTCSLADCNYRSED